MPQFLVDDAHIAELQTPSELDSQEPETAGEEPSEQRLSVFEDFLSNLELDDLSGGDEDTPDAPKPDTDPEP